MKQNFVIVALILVIVLLVCGYCEKRGQLSYLEKQFSKFELKKQDFKTIINKIEFVFYKKMIFVIKKTTLFLKKIKWEAPKVSKKLIDG